jgi:hypothetical protein
MRTNGNEGTEMGKTRSDETLSGKPIARKIIAKMKRQSHGNVVDIKSWVDTRDTAAEINKEIAARNEYSDLHPAFASYAYAQTQVSLISEQLTALKEMARFAEIVSRAEELYMPEGPPMSPLTRSYFTCWAFFDACTGLARETIGTTIIEIGTTFGMPTELLRLIRQMQKSRMGFYIYRGREDDLTVLEDLVTGAVCRAIVPSGECGKAGELWYVRVLPPPIPGGEESVVFTTPYIMLHAKLQEWREYFHRTIPATAPTEAYERHLKYGPTRQYWHDFVLEAYVNYRSEAIYLVGLPDIPESRPHSAISEKNGWNPLT